MAIKNGAKQRPKSIDDRFDGLAWYMRECERMATVEAEHGNPQPMAKLLELSDELKHAAGRLVTVMRTKDDPVPWESIGYAVRLPSGNRMSKQGAYQRWGRLVEGEPERPGHQAA